MVGVGKFTVAVPAPPGPLDDDGVAGVKYRELLVPHVSTTGMAVVQPVAGQ